ncbi:hypothetical protein jhhlp_005677 [Lomentospora prolificans]|uniref:THUMP domain-containing protein n=1 Tax=Lomentospora prolificans TaxID=41688 RepID=A0A2N3N3R3_9PEZI|nr:hypothetical protein jhhlp_005677 [Lomentospora prolificans]
MNDKKRKQPPSEGSKGDGKKSKRGNEGKWQTSHQRNNVAQRLELGTTIESGDAGIWVTCQRGLEKKAISEMTLLCDELGESSYGIKPPAQLAEKAALDAQDTNDIAASIEDELAGLKQDNKRPKTDHTFLPVHSGIECVFFMKTRPPVEPVAFVNKICDDAETCTQMSERKLRHINRLTPVTLIGKSLDNGIEKVAREVLSPSFELRPENGTESTPKTETKADIPAYTSIGSDTNAISSKYAIRPNIRASSVKRDEVINRVAALVGSKHTVNLTSPDKVILIEVFKNFCGMSVVDGPRWETLRKYNVNELYKQASTNSEKKKSETEPEPDTAVLALAQGKADKTTGVQA